MAGKILWIGIITVALSLSPAVGAQIIVDGSAMGGSGGGGDGLQRFKTIQQGVDRAQPGDMLIVRPGTYPEQIVVRHGGSADKPIIIRAEPIGSVIVDGADAVTGFEEDGHVTLDKSKVWVCRSYKPLYVPMGNDYNLRADWLKEGDVGRQQVELLSRDDMAWLDEKFLDQVDTADQLRFGTFWVDRKNGGIFVPLIAGDRPEDHLIEATKRDTLFDCAPDASFVHVRGFHFTRGGFNGNAVAKFGSYQTQGWVVEDNLADWGNFSGLKFYGSHNTLSRNTAAHNGCEGMQGIIHDTVLDGNASLYNNWKGIRDTYESGGGKFTESTHLIVRHHLAAYNLGPGLWFDINNSDITVEDSRFHDNKYAGLFMEIGPGPTVFRRNVSYANQGGGIVIGESNNVVVENNILADNWYGLDIRNLQGRHGRFGNMDANSPDVYWQTSDVTVRNNIFLKNTLAGIGNTCCYIDPKAQRISSDYNTFWDNRMYWWEKPDPRGPFAAMPTPPQVTATVGNSWIIENNYAPEKFAHLEEHSLWKDPRITNSDMYQFPVLTASPSPAPSP